MKKLGFVFFSGQIRVHKYFRYLIISDMLPFTVRSLVKPRPISSNEVIC